MNKFLKSVSLAYFPTKDKPLQDKYTRLRGVAQLLNLSFPARLRLEWMIFYQTQGKENVSQTAKYFSVSRKTLHKWLKRFDESNLRSLEEKSRRPHRLRQWEVTPTQEERIIKLRQKHLKWGKKKLSLIYQKQYQEIVSAWKVERVVRKHRLYPDNDAYKKKLRRQRKRGKNPKMRINDLKQSGFIPQPGKLWHTDSVIIWWYGVRRIILTAIEDQTKLGYARVYSSGSSRQAADFLKRLVYLSDGDIKIIHSDNGSEFAGEFEKACQLLNIHQIYSRIRTPKDNPALERFNWTVQDEWLSLSETGLDDIPEANHDLTEWLVEYNSVRPHESLDYQTPLEYAQENYFKVLPMWSARTRSCVVI